MIGNILGNRYRILREIGSGGMAKVYLAEDINQGQLVAVKVLYAHFGEDVAYLQRFTREAKLAGLLKNPHVVRVMDYGSSRDTHYLVMEYVEGKDLREILNDRGPLPWEEALSLVDQICEALENAHEYNIVHRDIKPQNIMLTDSGQLKVLDFGIARARMLPSLTQSGFVGSPYYISPEQAMGEDVDIRSDIYSCGIVLYEILSGRVPFDSKSPWSIISKHITSEFPEIDLSTSSLPDSVQTLLKRMVAKSPDDRLQSPTAVRQAVALILAGKKISADLLPAAKDTVNKSEMANKLYRRAEKAIEADDWQKAVNLLNQALNLDPHHLPATEKLAYAGTQARLNALYNAAMRAMESNRWQEAIDELTEIIKTAPEYKDSPKLLKQAQSAVDKQSTEQALSALYEKAITAFEVGDYTRAEKLFGHIKKSAPTYRRADALWAEARRRRTRNGGFRRLTEGLPQKSGRIKLPAAGLPLKWPALTAVVVIAIVAVIFLVSRNTPPPPQTAPNTAEIYAQAQQALAAEDTETAADLLAQLKAIDPSFADPDNLQDLLQEKTRLAQTLTQARSAIDNKQWTEATELLESLRETPSFEAETVTALLCDAYLARGMERLSKISNPKDRATVQAALADFQAGQAVCPPRQDLTDQITYAGAYLSVSKEDDPAILIDTLQNIIKVEPNYAGGQAAQNLYEAYLQRGDAFQEAGNPEAALEDYAVALTLNVPDTSAAQEKQTALKQLFAATPSPAGPEATPEQPEATPTSRPSLKYAAPVLLAPAPMAEFHGKFEEIILSWKPVGVLAANEFYDVTIRYFVGDEARYWGSGLITETSWQVPVEAGFGLAGKDKFDWWVTVRLGGTAANGQPDIPLSPSSEERPFIWRP